MNKDRYLVRDLDQMTVFCGTAEAGIWLLSVGWRKGQAWDVVGEKAPTWLQKKYVTFTGPHRYPA